MVAIYELMELLPETFEPSFSGRHYELYIFLKRYKKKFSEEEATKSFLGENGQRKYFNKLKNRLKKELVKFISIQPNWEDANYDSRYESCYTGFTAYKVLLVNGKRGAATEMAKSILPKLQKSELHSLVYTVARDLEQYYSSINILPHLAKEYGKIVQEQVAFINAEAIVREHHNKVSLITNTRESYTHTMLEVFRIATKKTLPLLKLGSNAINRYIYSIVIAQYMAEFNYEKVIEYSTQAYKSFPKSHPNYKIMYFGYIQMQLPALMALGKLEEAKRLAKESSHMVASGGFNWHLAFIRRCLICLHAGDYQKAYDLYKEQSKQECPFPSLAEYKGIIWGYLYFLIKVEKIKEYSEERFHLGKFLNEVPIYSKDKAGNNINLLIIQIIVRLYREQYGQIIDRIEALNIYTRTYTKRPETTRANLFINMIIKMENASFHLMATERKTQKLFEKLQNTPLRFGQNLAIEVIPYEVLWNEILDLLENKTYKIRRKNNARNISQK